MTASWPGDSATVERWVRAALRSMGDDSGEVRISGLQKVEVTADLSEAELRTLTVDASRVDVRIDATSAGANSANSQAATDQHRPETVTTHPGMLRDFRLTAHPLRIEGTPVDLDVQAFDVPVNWTTFAGPVHPGIAESIHTLEPRKPMTDARGTFDLSMRTHDAVPLITSVARPALRESGIRLGRVRLEVTEEPGHGIRIEAYAGVRWKLLAASMRATAVVDVTPDAVITVRELVVGSRNPLVRLGLRLVRKQLRDAVGRSVDLNEQLEMDGVGIRIHDLRVLTGERLGVAGRLS